MFKNWSLKTKMIGAFLIGAIMLLIVGGTGYQTLGTVISKYDVIANVNLPNIAVAGEMRTASRRIEYLVTHLGLEDQTPATLEAAKKDFDAAVTEYQTNDKAYNDIPFSPGEEALYNAVNEHWKKVLPEAHKLFELANSKSATARQQYFSVLNSEYYPEVEAHIAALRKITEFHQNMSKTNREQASVASSRGTWVSTVAISVGFFLSLFIGFTFSKILSKALDEIANRLGVGAEQVAAASKQISDAGAELSASATEQAAALQETVASVDEISAMINKNADNAKKSQEFSSRSHSSATKGKQAVEEMISSIDEINRSNTEIMAQIETSNREISDIVKVISEIGNKTKIINDIVFQTKLLSFNASVEAARAGEHGKGFAVVAEEVGNLAQMSGNAAKEISQMLDGSIQKVEGIVNDTKSKVERLVVTGKEKVEAGTMTAKNCGTVLDEIVVSVNEVNQMINEIATASHEQSQGVQEITKAMAQLDQVTQQNASASQQSANAAESLTSQAEELHQMVEVLLDTVQGEGQRNAPKVTKAKKEKKHQEHKVVHLAHHAEKKRTATSASHAPVKKAAGAEHIPAENDPRFEEV